MTETNEKEVSNFSIKEILKIAKEYLIEVLKYSWLIAIGAVLLGKVMYDRKMTTPTTYAADFSFAFATENINRYLPQSQCNTLFRA